MTDPPAFDEGQPNYLILATYRSHRQILLYPESRVVKANCGHHAWLSPQGESYFERCYTVCVDCAEEVVTDHEGSKVAVPGALAAIRRTAGAEAEREARSFMEQLGIVEAGQAFRRPPEPPH